MVLLLLAAELRERFPHFCSMASHYVKVEPDGAVYPCCNAPPELRMGNVHEQPLPTIWNGERYRRFRQRMHARDYPSCCRTCDVLVGNPRFEAPAAGGAESAEAPQK
ncbi:MAG: SPASM domain-containing protein [Planctomycetota bacterium]